MQSKQYMAVSQSCLGGSAFEAPFSHVWLPKPFPGPISKLVSQHVTEEKLDVCCGILICRSRDPQNGMCNGVGSVGPSMHLLKTFLHCGLRYCQVADLLLSNLFGVRCTLLPNRRSLVWSGFEAIRTNCLTCRSAGIAHQSPSSAAL